MKLYKIIFLFWIYNIFAIFQFSWMAGVWFDSEDLMQRSDYEIYKPPLWQYQLYYILFGVYVVISSLLLYLWQKKIRNTEGGIIVWVLHRTRPTGEYVYKSRPDKVNTEKLANNYEKRSFRIKKYWANAHRNIRRYRGYFVSNRKI